MAKHRKTRQEKRVADLRHISYHLDTLPAEVSNSDVKKSTQRVHIEAISRPRTQTVNYSYVSRDLKKTAVVTAGVLLAQIILFVIINRV